MPNTSATGGYLLPEQFPAPLDDDALDDFFQVVVVGITGLAPKLVRPRFQEKPLKQPDRGATWAAVGVMRVDTEFDGFIRHNPGDPLTGEGAGDEVQRYETLEIMASFYGPRSHHYAALLRDGLSIPQNNEPFQVRDMGLADLGSIIRTGDLVNQGWIRRVDFTFRVRRTVYRTYPVLNLESLDFKLGTKSGA